eukprot:13781804-Alexandrium_andersonii.AAC.1
MSAIGTQGPWAPIARPAPAKLLSAQTPWSSTLGRCWLLGPRLPRPERAAGDLGADEVRVRP